MIKILYEDNHLLVVEKPCNILVQADDTNDLDLLTILKDDLKKRYNKPNNVYLGLVHRLDRPVGGVMVFAKTSKAASRLSSQISKHQFKKEYHAVIVGKAKNNDTLIDHLLKNNKTNMVMVTKKTTPNAKYAELSYECVAWKNELSLVKINLKTGRSHQIRVQFASRNLPLFGDQRYNPNAKVGQQIALWATSLTLIHPTLKQEMTFTCELPNQIPFAYFK